MPSREEHRVALNDKVGHLLQPLIIYALQSSTELVFNQVVSCHEAHETAVDIKPKF